MLLRSRYKSDFKDEQRLGKGGYGVVVSAINGAWLRFWSETLVATNAHLMCLRQCVWAARGLSPCGRCSLHAVLDGLKYAIKKIKMAGESSSRITREVNLLSRLQHPNVVRYFQVREGAPAPRQEEGAHAAPAACLISSPASSSWLLASVRGSQ